MSNKTEVLSFDNWINVNGYNFRPEQYDLYKFLYEAGQQSKQSEIDELRRGNHNLSVMVAEAESYSEYWKYERDELKKRIESAMELLEYNEYVDSALQALEILKGEETK